MSACGIECGTFVDVAFGGEPPCVMESVAGGDDGGAMSQGLVEIVVGSLVKFGG